MSLLLPSLYSLMVFIFLQIERTQKVVNRQNLGKGSLVQVVRTPNNTRLGKILGRYSNALELFFDDLLTQGLEVL